MKKTSLPPPILPDQSALLAAIIQASPDAIISVTLRGIINCWNPAAQKLFGYSTTEIINKNISLLIPDDRLTEQAGIEQTITSTESCKQYGSIRKRKDGSLFDAAITISHIPNEDGENTGFLMIIKDISDTLYRPDDSTISEAHLLKAYGDKANILESITDGFFTVDKNWIVTYWNKEAERILRMPRKNIRGKNIWDVYAAAIPLKFYSEYHRAVTEQVPVNFEEFFPPLNLWIDVSAYPSEDGLAIYFKDITERKLTQENIRVIKERHEMVAKVTNDAIYEWDIVANVTYWGEGFETLFGHTRSEDKMPAESWINNLHPEEKETLWAASHQAFENKKTSMTRELRFKCADGTYKTVFDKLAILYDENQQPVKIVGALQDITERKNNEIAIAELNDQLSKRAEELIQSNEELERFAYVASHDLQEPLRMVGSFLQLLQKKYQGQLDETAGQYIAFAVDGAERMKRLILDLLEYSRIGTNKEAMTNLDMNETVATVLKNFSNNTKEPGTLLRAALLPVIKANKMQITQLLQNLVGNALKYNTSPVPEIEIGYEEKEDQWEFFVKDNGIGIEQKFLNKIFIIFQRLHNKNQFSGTGIGLAICKKIVERHGGSIWVKSEPKHGSTFFFTIKK
jgi:PAS domain S-box-containing protein